MYRELLEKPSIHLPKDQSFNGIVLKGEDILVLTQIFTHASMRSPAIHELYQMTYGKERNPNWISNRLKKMVEAGLLEQMREQVGERGSLSAVRYYHYRLNKRGYDLLVNEGITTPDETEKVITLTKRKGIPTSHTRATSYLANSIFMELLANQKRSEGFIHVRGGRHPELGVTEETSLEVRGLIVPDWVFERKNVTVAIEVDTGTQRGKHIASKYKRYKKMGKHFESLGKQLVVIFAVTDPSITELSLGAMRQENRDKRISSVKETFPLHSEWPDNLHFYVATAKRVPSIVSRILSGREPTSGIDKTFFTEAWLNLTRTFLSEKFSLQMEPVDDVLLPNRNRQLDAQFSVSLQKEGTIKEKHLVMYADESSVRSYQEIRNNAMLIYQYNANPNQTIPLYLNTIYYETESAEEDVYGHDVYESIYYRDIESLEKASKLPEQERQLFTRRLSSPFKKEEVEMFK